MWQVPTDYFQNDWNRKTCEVNAAGERLYTHQSDLFQLGVLLEKWLEYHPNVEGHITDFADGLREKKWTARQALTHPFLIGRPYN